MAEKHSSPKTTMESFKSIAELVPLFTGIFILIGCFDLYFYYGLFGINIFNYIRLDEAIVHFLEALSGFIVYLLFIGFISAFFAICFYFLKKSDERKKNNPESSENAKDTKKDNRKINLTVIFVLLFIILIYFVMDHYFENNFFIRQFNNFGMITVAIGMVALAFMLRSLINLSPAELNLFRFVGVVIILLSFQLGKSYSGYRRIVDKETRRGEGITFKEKGTLNSHNILIGRTGNFIFIYNDSTQRATCYPAEQMEQTSH